MVPSKTGPSTSTRYHQLASHLFAPKVFKVLILRVKTRQPTSHRVAITSQTWQPRSFISRWTTPTQASKVVALFSKTRSTSMISTTRQLARSPTTLSPCWITYPQTPGSTMCLSWLKAILVSRRVASSCRMKHSVRASTSRSTKLLIRALETQIIMVKTLYW